MKAIHTTPVIPMQTSIALSNGIIDMFDLLLDKSALGAYWGRLL